VCVKKFCPILFSNVVRYNDFRQSVTDELSILMKLNFLVSGKVRGPSTVKRASVFLNLMLISVYPRMHVSRALPDFVRRRLIFVSTR